MCCGNTEPPPPSTPTESGRSIITGYATTLPNGQTYTYATRVEAEAVRSKFAGASPVVEVTG